MSKIWVGYSEVLGFRDLIVEYIDPFFGTVDEDEEPIGRFELEFGAERSQPGSFEVYEKVDSEDFDFDHVLKRFPFSHQPKGLCDIDWRTAKTVFFMQNESEPKILTDDRVRITDVMIVKFDWE